MSGDGESGRCEVLVVDDDRDARDALEQYLRIFGYQPLVASNGREALDLLRAGQRPALILLDLRMPVMDGWQFVRAIEDEPDLRGIPIAVTSAASAPPPKPPNSAGLFHKPIFLPQLLWIVRKYCGEGTAP